MKRIVIIGASGHGKVVADIASKNGYEDILFLDDADDVYECAGFPVVGKTSDTEDFNSDSDFIVAIGNAEIREKIQYNLKGNLATLIHPNATVACSAILGEGSVVMAGAVINCDATIGNGCIINTCASVDHDSVIGDYSHISVGAHIAGKVNIGSKTWIGIGASVSNNVSICSDCLIGAGSVLIRDIIEPGTYVGVPARKLH